MENLKTQEEKIVILPMNRVEIPMGTFRSILKQAGIDKNTFIRFLKK